MEVSVLRGRKPHMITLFFYPKVVETSMLFKDLLAALQNSSYGWSPTDVVELKIFSSTEQKFLPLTCDEHLGLLFTLNVERRFGKILIEVLQPRNEHDKGKVVQKSSVSASAPALLVGQNQAKLVVLKVTICLLPLLVPLLLSLLQPM